MASLAVVAAAQAATTAQAQQVVRQTAITAPVISIATLGSADVHINSGRPVPGGSRGVVTRPQIAISGLGLWPAHIRIASDK